MILQHSNPYITVSSATGEEHQAALGCAFLTMQDVECPGQLVMTATRINPFSDDEDARFNVEHWMNVGDGSWSHSIEPRKTRLTYRQAIVAMCEQMKLEHEHLQGDERHGVGDESPMYED